MMQNVGHVGLIDIHPSWVNLVLVLLKARFVIFYSILTAIFCTIANLTNNSTNRRIGYVFAGVSGLVTVVCGIFAVLAFLA